MTASDNKRIAKNTLFLYIRMGISMLISLYTSRVILQTLGVVDLGIYNVVGGITSIFTWLAGSLTNSTQRFLNIAIGNNAPQKVNQVFTQSFWLYAIFAVVSIVALEIGGSWMIHHKLTIPADRIGGAMWTLHATSFTLAVTLIGSVYDSVLIARENMKIYAYIGMADVVLKLVIVYLLLIFPFDKLKVYAVLLSAVFVISKLTTIIYCRLKYKECRLRFEWNRGMVKEMLGFVGWNATGTIIFILNNQGIDILLNIFFGPVVNAAKAISNQVRNVILNFTSNFLTAARPQIVKRYAAKDYGGFLDLIFRTSKYLFFISWILGFTLIVRIGNILHFWLKTVPDYTGPFCVWVLIFIMINVIADPINSAFQAIGKQSRYITVGSGIYILAFPLSYAAFKMGYSPVSSFVILAAVRFVYLIAVSWLLHREVAFEYNREYIFNVLFPIVKVVVASIVIILPINLLVPQTLLGMFFVLILTATISIGCVFLFGLSKADRAQVKNIIHKKLSR